MNLDPWVVPFAVLSLVVVLEAIAIVWLWRRQRRWQRLCQRWRRIQEHQQGDVIGLCAAAVRMDERLQQLVRDLGEIRERSEVLRGGSEDAASYQAAIACIREGGGIEELVGQCGLTREEANLLLRLYGGRSPDVGDPDRH